MMISMSQAYILKKVWGIGTSNRSYLKCLLKSWTSRSFISNNSKTFLYQQGVITHGELSNLREKNWIKWLKNFDRYNLPPSIWHKITPHQWRFRVSEYWWGLESRKLVNEENKNLSIFVANVPSERIEKRNKLLKSTSLIYSYFNSSKDSLIETITKLDKQCIYNDISTHETHKFRFICNRKISDLFMGKKNSFFECNLLLWLLPKLMEKKGKGVYQQKEISDFVIKNEAEEILRNKELFRERELNQSSRQWKWKSNCSEKKFKRLGNMASLMTFMQNQETMISLSDGMREDLNSFRLFFRTGISPDRLTINSEHRLPRLLDDQILMYKMISTLLSFKQRLEAVVDVGNTKKNKYYWDEILINMRKKNLLLNSPNIEDILLPRRRRELRILNRLSSNDKESQKTFGGSYLAEEVKADRSAKIKRFIWSSYRFEDLACMNRFWFSALDGSRSSMLRFRIYPSR